MQDSIILSDISFAQLLTSILPHTPSVRVVVFLAPRAHMPPQTAAPMLRMLCYEDLLHAERPHLAGFRWAEVAETAACGLCYTSGTTGNPKVRTGVCGGWGVGGKGKGWHGN